MRPAVHAWPTPQAFLANLGAIDEVAGCIIHGGQNQVLLTVLGLRARGQSTERGRPRSGRGRRC